MGGVGFVYDNESTESRSAWSGTVLFSYPLEERLFDAYWAFDLQLSTMDAFTGMKIGTVAITGGISMRWWQRRGLRAEETMRVLETLIGKYI